MTSEVISLRQQLAQQNGVHGIEDFKLLERANTLAAHNVKLKVRGEESWLLLAGSSQAYDLHSTESWLWNHPRLWFATWQFKKQVSGPWPILSGSWLILRFVTVSDTMLNSSVNVVTETALHFVWHHLWCWLTVSYFRPWLALMTLSKVVSVIKGTVSSDIGFHVSFYKIKCLFDVC